MRRYFLVILFLSGISFNISAQDDHFLHMPKPSPTVTVDQGFSTSFIKIKYSRPSVKDREIFGQLVPYNKLWRTGANAPTKITFGEDVSIEGYQIKAGTYTLLTIPKEKEWTIIINTDESNSGTNGYDESKNVLELPIIAQEIPYNQESFRISIENITYSSCKIVLTWENTKVEIPIETDNNQRILDHLNKELKGKNPPYSTAAGYYLSTNQNLEKAVEYEKKAIEQNPKHFYLYWNLAEIYQKLGKHDKALEAAKKSAEVAKGGAYEDEYKRLYKDLKNKNK